MEILAPLCTDSHPNTNVTRRTSPLRSAKLYMEDVIYRFAHLLKRCSAIQARVVRIIKAEEGSLL
jgi:hypothetical protein